MPPAQFAAGLSVILERLGGVLNDRLMALGDGQGAPAQSDDLPGWTEGDLCCPAEDQPSAPHYVPSGPQRAPAQ